MNYFPILAVSDVVWQALIAACVTIILAAMQQKTKKAVDKNREKNAETAKAASVKTEEVKTTLVESTSKTDGKLDVIHTLVNSNMGAQLRVSALALRRIAEMTKNPDDTAAADVAEKYLTEHLKKQQVVDAQNTKT